VIVCSAANDDLLQKQEFKTDLGVRILLKPFRIDVREELVEEMLALGSRSELAMAIDSD
jgi:hypothetical protein